MFVLVVVLLSGLVYFQCSYYLLSQLVQDQIDSPYMDEIFHVPQAQQYCLGNYDHWNDKITTLPGLYILSAGVYRSLAYLLNKTDQEVILSQLCNLFNLRLVNLVLSTLCYIVLVFILLQLKRSDSKKSILFTVLSALSISLFPLNYFFQFLYYTDSGSTLFILLSYLQHLKGNHYMSALLGSVAILFRQTNIVWIVFFIGLQLLSNIEQLCSNKKSSSSSNINTIISQRNKKHSNLFELVTKTPSEAFKDFDPIKFVNKIYREDLWGKKLIYSELYHVFDMSQLRPYLMVVSTFILFVAVNNGIVVGDRSNHQASFHLVQLFYFLSFACFFSFSSLLTFKKIKGLVSFATTHLHVKFLLLALIAIGIHNFTYEHPFLLADNRHYTFYLWSRVFRRHELVRYLLAPVYLAAGYLFYKNLTQSGKNLGWLVAFFVCLFVALVPQQLIEFRYFIIPYLIYRVNIQSQMSGLKELGLEFLLHSVINILTIYLFISKVFYWPNSQEPQRFMW